ncbi:11211_t:CDS:2, partial [Scutellospora calospora]
SACKRDKELSSIVASRDIRDIKICIVDKEEAVIHRVVKDKKQMETAMAKITLEIVINGELAREHSKIKLWESSGCKKRMKMEVRTFWILLTELP